MSELQQHKINGFITEYGYTKTAKMIRDLYEGDLINLFIALEAMIHLTESYAFTYSRQSKVFAL